jgi:hypothetical protein
MYPLSIIVNRPPLRMHSPDGLQIHCCCCHSPTPHTFPAIVICTGSARLQDILWFEGIWWPLLCTVQDTQNLDLLHAPSHAVDNNEQCSGRYQLTGAALPSHPSHRRMIDQQVDLVLDSVTLFDCGAHIVGRDIVKLRISICECSREPSNDQALPPAAIRAASSARFFAHPF